MIQKEDFLEYKETLRELNNYLTGLCIQFKHPPVKLKTDRYYHLKGQEPARFNSSTNTILLNRCFVLKSTVENIIRHEFRHSWQQVNYRAVYNWWLVENASLYNVMHNMRNADGRQLSHIYCPLEIDAIAFETSDSGNEEILIDFDREIKSNVDLLQRYTDILKHEGVSY